MNNIPLPQMMDIGVRAYVCRDKERQNPSNKKTANPKAKRRKIDRPSEWVLVFDTETTINASQALRFGTYQVRKDSECLESGIFYDPLGLSELELETLKAYAIQHDLVAIPAAEFIDDVFYRIGYHYRGQVVGFNLPFDISRLAIDHNSARTSKRNRLFQNGFSFKLSDNRFHPRVQVKHVSSRDSFIQFTGLPGQLTNENDRKRDRWQPTRRGFFIDLKTLAAALTSKSHSLGSLAKALDVTAQKHETHEHGQILSDDYIAYAVQDTQTTWECFVKLSEMYEIHALNQTPAHKIHSEASLGKAYLREMGIKPWKELQPGFPASMLGMIMSTYYGGRSEIHIRRQSVQVLYCDFLSMYPTVCTLMGLWQFVIAKGVSWQDTTNQTRKFLDKTTIDDLQRPETWRNLCTLVKVRPQGDIFPVRAKYDREQYTIGLNHLTSDEDLWYTLADCIASKLLMGHAPQIIEAITFSTCEPQENLKPINISGNEAYCVDPTQTDLFKRVIDLRTVVKKRMKTATQSERDTLDSQQLALKILANSTSYGIFVELNVESSKEPEEFQCYGGGEDGFAVKMDKFEAEGSFFHPMLATFITGAARLMLAVTEILIKEQGLDWAFCDTDSMAIAKPDGMSVAEFYNRARQVCAWFTTLNPYTVKEPLLKIEGYNYSLSYGSAFAPLYCYAISSKRYALFNRDPQGQIILRKVSAHGLGHLMNPNSSDARPKLEDIPPWQQDFWLRIIMAADQGPHVHPDYSDLPYLSQPAISRYGATTPVLLRWFDRYNHGKAYHDQVKPLNFLLSMQTNETKPNLSAYKKKSEPIRPVAPFLKDPVKAVQQGFDRLTGDPLTPDRFKTYRESLAHYHLHPEDKFMNGEYLDHGFTQRRHIQVKTVQHIGKEANKWEEQYFTGHDPDSQLEYGTPPNQDQSMLKEVKAGIIKYGTKKIADQARLSARHLYNIREGKTKPSRQILNAIQKAIISIQDNGL
jgi:hypothetical protein